MYMAGLVDLLEPMEIVRGCVMGSAGGLAGYLRVNRPSRPVMAVVVGVVMRRLVANITTTITITTQPASTRLPWPRL
jgi:hypothetical protein